MLGVSLNQADTSPDHMLKVVDVNPQVLRQINVTSPICHQTTCLRLYIYESAGAVANKR